MNLLNKIGLGTVQFGQKYGISNTTGVTPLSEISNILEYCSQKQINILDTAFGYGESEIKLGKNNLESFKIVSKFLPFKDTGLNIEQQLLKSLANLDQNSLYGYLAHRSLDVCENSEQWEELNRLKSIGLVKKIGFSFNEPQELRALLEKKMIPDLIQVPYNFFDNRFAPGFLELKEKYNCEIHTRSVFLQGLFFMKTSELHSFFEPVKAEIQEVQKLGSSLASSLLKYALSNENIDCVVFGVNSLAQLESNIEGLNKALILDRPKNMSFNPDILTPSKWPTA
ncbi:aldo/keto reductase [Ulvibacter antarcticus]|uniref:Aryl-alcohol dehydrogenase-like predicted oxidoreductase n=1 Tax=Ulvibacter antarcticus TaxID=442714 RepID=A0A3L9YZ42_9FLAO|nr:aldo/keto reductase [Ulvibacter antarcticus]RMA65991.1 aryl-alcohol dehydrogenase-like predicted oxidoreductase [Ulvibacter antarcticus]